jgi:cytochrome d ubiquinol oxidase subunit II
VAAGLAAVFVGWTLVDQSDRGGLEAASVALGIVAILSLAYAAVAVKVSSARAFAASCVGILGLFTALFVDLFPNAMVSSTSEAFNLTLADASSSDYTLTVMTVVAVILVPVVLLYQGWTYWVFRHRIGADDFEDVSSPIDLLERKFGEADASEPPGASPPA